MMLPPEKKVYHSQLLLVTCGVVIVIAAVMVAKSFFPHLSCPIHSSLGIKCPGCGGTSAVNQLLAGDVLAALSSNAVFSVSLILLVLYNFYFLIAKVSNKSVKVVQINLKMGVVFLLVIVAFTVIRNW